MTLSRRSLLRALCGVLAAPFLVRGAVANRRASWTVTLSRPLQAAPKLYDFTEPKFIGKSYLLYDSTIYVRRGT